MSNHRIAINDTGPLGSSVLHSAYEHWVFIKPYGIFSEHCKKQNCISIFEIYKEICTVLKTERK